MPHNLYSFPQSHCDFCPEGEDVLLNKHISNGPMPVALLRLMDLDPTEARLLDELPEYSSCVIRTNTRDNAHLLPIQGANHQSRLAQTTPADQRHFRTFIKHDVFTSYCLVIQCNTLEGLSSTGLQKAYKRIMRHYGG